MTVGIRLVSEDDTARLTELLRANREHLAPWDPLRDEAFFSEPVQRAGIEDALGLYEQGMAVPFVVLVDGEVAGRVTVNAVFRGAFQSANLGYWVGRAYTGRGVATAAVGAAVRVAFEDLGLHRLQAATLVHNHASRRVLARNGFTEIGTAPRYTQVAGRWQDHVLHQVIAPGG